MNGPLQLLLTRPGAYELESESSLPGCRSVPLSLAGIVLFRKAEPLRQLVCDLFAPQLRAYPRKQLRWIEGQRQVIIGPEIQSPSPFR